MSIKQDKIKRAAGVLHVIFAIFYWLSIAAAALCGLVFVVAFFLPQSMFAYNGHGLGFTFDNTIYFSFDSPQSLNLKPLVQLGTPFLAAIMVILAVGTRQIIDILKSVVSENPFAGENASRLTVIAIDLLIASLVVNLAKFLFISHMVHLLKIPQINANFSLNPSLFITGFLVLILAGVFKYGNYLKNEFDATL